MGAGGPIVMGGSGGSGTRALAEFLHANGVALPRSANQALDCAAFEGFLDRWVDRIAERTKSLDYRFADLPEAMRADIERDLAQCLAQIRATLKPKDAARWGWKCPRSIFVLPVLAALVPDLTFVHLVRDGRDMLLSKNQAQTRRHFTALTGGDRRRNRKLASATVWSKVNLEAARFGERELGGRYLRRRYEDLCAGDPSARAGLLAALRLEQSVLDGIFSLSEGTGRWQSEDPTTARRLHRAIGPALVRFGYVGEAELARMTAAGPAARLGDLLWALRGRPG
jgi:hypothetical protein